MELDYFYGQQADMFSFYRIPKVLFTDQRYWNVSTDAKLLYGILLDRMNLSAKNGWLDESGRVYIIFTIDEIKSSLGCAEQKAQKMLAELDKKCGLIERKRQGLGKPNLIYVKNFTTSSRTVDNAVDKTIETGKTPFLNCENHNSGTVKITTQELRKSQCNNTDINNTEFSDTDPFLSSEKYGMDNDGKDKFAQYYQYFKRQFEIDILRQRYPYDGEMLENILDLVVETVCSKRQYIRIASDDKPAEIVRSRLMKLDSEHISYVMMCIKENTTKVRNIKQYMLATLYNAQLTMSSYYDTLVRHDMANGRV